MNELEKLQRAEMYLTKLANGIDPLTDTELPNDTVLNNVRLSRCFFYVAEILQKVINNGGEVGGSGKARFHMTEEQRSTVVISPEPVGVNDIARRINAVIDTNKMKGLTGAMINNWLMEQGLLMADMRDGKQVKVISPEGAARGIRAILMTPSDGRTFEKNVFNESLQRYIVDQANTIAMGSSKKETNE